MNPFLFKGLIIGIRSYFGVDSAISKAPHLVRRVLADQIYHVQVAQNRSGHLAQRFIVQLDDRDLRSGRRCGSCECDQSYCSYCSYGSKARLARGT
jgi:hypothetical protein